MPKHAPLPGYIAFMKQVLRTIKRFRRPLFIFALLFMLINTAVLGIAQQENYEFFSDTIATVSQSISRGEFGQLPQVMTLFGVAVTGGLNGELSDTQQMILLFATVIFWMALVWFLRNQLTGHKVTVRESLYSSGSPIVPMFVLVLIGLLQFVPAAIGVLIYVNAQNSGVTGGVELMMFSIMAALFFVLSLYWVLSTLFASFIVTIPGTYPMKAIRLAGDIMIGRRMQLLLRLVWLFVFLLVLWVVIFFPTLLLASWINISWLPLVTISLQVLTAFSLIFSVTYVYLLYRRMLDDPYDNA